MAENFYNNKVSVQEYIKMAEGFNGQNLINNFKKYLAPNSKVLEIGSGPGSDWEILNNTFDVTGSDNSQEFLGHLNQEYPNGKFLKLDATTLDLKGITDGIYSNKVLHHLTDPDLKKSIKRQWEILSEGGIICHSFWKGTGSEIFKGLFVNYHLQNDIIDLFSEHFEILKIELYAEFEKDDSLLLIGKKK